MNFETEKGFMQAVIDLARLQGWLVYHPYDSRRSQKGYPDLTMVRDGRLVFVELKTDKGKLTEQQREWGAGLVAVRQRIRDTYQLAVADYVLPVRYFLWRPSDWPEIEQVLQREGE